MSVDQALAYTLELVVWFLAGMLVGWCVGSFR